MAYDYLAQFKRTTSIISTKQHKNFFQPVLAEDLQRTEKILGRSLPSELLEFYQTVGSGRLAESVSGPAFSTALGMLEYVTKKPMEEQMFDKHRRSGGLNAGLQKMVNWFRENF